MAKSSRFYVPVWNGLLTAKHRQEMGAAIWTYLVLVDMTPKHSKTGSVLGGALLQIDDLAKKTGYSYPQVQRDLEKLKGKYIDIKRSARGFKIKIRNWRPVDLSISKADNSPDLSISKADKTHSKVDNSLSKVDNSIEQESLQESLQKSTSVEIEQVNFDRSSFKFSIPPKTKVLWQESFTAVNIDTETSKAAAWLKANPKNRKQNYERFLFNWLSRAQEKAPGTGNGQRAEPDWMAEARKRKEAKASDKAGI